MTTVFVQSRYIVAPGDGCLALIFDWNHCEVVGVKLIRGDSLLDRDDSFGLTAKCIDRQCLPELYDDLAKLLPNWTTACLNSRENGESVEKDIVGDSLNECVTRWAENHGDREPLGGRWTSPLEWMQAIKSIDSCAVAAMSARQSAHEYVVQLSSDANEGQVAFQSDSWEHAAYKLAEVMEAIRPRKS